MALIRGVALLAALLARCDAKNTEYELKYGAKLRALSTDEVVAEPPRRLAFGSCQKLELNPKHIYDSIVRFNPQYFLFTGDIVYAPNGCCEPECVKNQYDRLKASKVYQDFAKTIKRIDGIYDDHDLGINDGHGNYEHKAHSQKYLLDFFDKPRGHYRRKRKGAYFSVLFRDPANKKNTVKLIVLDVRYHRTCYYYCPCKSCHWKPEDTYKFVYARLINYLFGFGCNHKGDMLGAEQWKWLEGQLHNSDAQAHVIVSSMQIFTRHPITESWGLIPEAKDRLVDLMITTKPKNTVFVSGDVHYGEIDVMDGVVEITASSLTHAFLAQGKSLYRPFALSVYYTRTRPYMYNNFGGIEYDFDAAKGTMKWKVLLMDEDGKVVSQFINDGKGDPLAPYTHIDKKRKSFYKNTRIVKCRGVLAKLAVVYFILCAFSWMVLIPYIGLCALVRGRARATKLKPQ